ncbi:hypothetical protein [Bythopirellula goksoeyrii]|uniref:Uncharacterized protein n=1 Tax=Bythopirellula goksoeyrii TaxID=1400387 RepID=A0A5B9QHV1_9BACT|nr:hypothetical protein [Bythopirellula goksoeyrii]QEG37160.1 hypothetical protein Pr1d_45010 [Bythopirellula goksoeyrii]
MAQASIPPEMLKQAMKEALVETFSEQRDLLREVFADVLEEISLVAAIEEGRETDMINRDQVFDLLDGGS